MSNIFYLLLCLIPLKAVCSLPVDVSFLAVDLKYHPTRGAQICEIQHGVNSTFKGYAMLHDDEQDQIPAKLFRHLDSFYEKSWATPNAFVDPGIKEFFPKNPRWICSQDLKGIESHKQFLLKATQAPKDIFSLNNYRGFVFVSPNSSHERKEFRNKYPGVVLIDHAFSGYQNNKLTMTKLLMDDPYTEEHKPIWGHYFKDDDNLAERILNDIPSKLLVIKPLMEFFGTGIIILRREDLKETLENLFDKKKKKPSVDDPAYAYWKKKNSFGFIVEEFIESEPILVPHLEGKLFSPTMRLVFLLFFDKNGIRIECLGGYYNLPQVSLSEGGSLNDVHKSACKIPFYEKVDPELRMEAEVQIKKVLQIIYQKLLGT